MLDDSGDVVARGVSIRSRLDEFNPGAGKRRAYNRALKATGRKQNCEMILLNKKANVFIDNLALFLAIDRFGPFKSFYKPSLTPTEILLLTNKLNMR